MKDQYIAQIRALEESFLKRDIDTITFQELSDVIVTLDALVDGMRQDDALPAVQGLLEQLIPHLYVARGFALNDIPRPMDFYVHMQTCKHLVHEISRMIQS